jgi:N,N'-diacetyllegionaminate synthase
MSDSDDIFDRVSGAKRCFVIAEIGSNHDGDFSLALRLMDVAAEADADAVKFQSFLADQLVKPDNQDYAMLKRLELQRDWYWRLKEAADQRGLVFFSTATNDTTIGWMEEIGAELYKVASPSITHLPLIRRVAGLGKPIIMSTGMTSLKGTAEAVETVLSAGNDRLALLHCVSQYPADPSIINLRVIPTLHRTFGLPVGFSDHTLEIGTAVAAVAIGARIIEKHLTYDRSADGPDHHYALEPDDFVMMTRNIRVVEAALGSSTRLLSQEEASLGERHLRSLHFSRDLPSNVVVADADLIIVRPNDGLHARHADAVAGMRLLHSVKSGSPVTWRDFKP